MKKVGLDQTLAWILAVLLSLMIFGVFFFITKKFADSGHGNENHHGEEASHEDDSPSESSHGEKKSGHGDEQSSHHEEAGAPKDAHGESAHPAPASEGHGDAHESKNTHIKAEPPKADAHGGDSHKADPHKVEH